VMAASPTKIRGEAAALGARAAEMEPKGRREVVKRLWGGRGDGEGKGEMGTVPTIFKPEEGERVCGTMAKGEGGGRVPAWARCVEESGEGSGCERAAAVAHGCRAWAAARGRRCRVMRGGGRGREREREKGPTHRVGPSWQWGGGYDRWARAGKRKENRINSNLKLTH
jgi:hypothetical protein